MLVGYNAWTDIVSSDHCAESTFNAISKLSQLQASLYGGGGASEIYVLLLECFNSMIEQPNYFVSLEVMKMSAGIQIHNLCYTRASDASLTNMKECNLLRNIFLDF